MRVGGRLKNSNLVFNVSNSSATQTHINSAYYRAWTHTKLIRGFASHDGFRAPTLLTIIAIHRGIIQKCITFTANPNQSEALMGSLPASRVNVSRPFSSCGVNYAGPLLLREGKRRNARSHKAYVSFFVCFATKAVHLELVNDLTSEAFIAFKWFISRRDRPDHIYSDTAIFTHIFRQPSLWARINKFKNYTTCTMIHKSSLRLKIFFAN